MEIENNDTDSTTRVALYDMVQGKVYRQVVDYAGDEMTKGELCLMTDEGKVVDLSDGCLWEPEDEERFVEVRGHFVLEG